MHPSSCSDPVSVDLIACCFPNDVQCSWIDRRVDRRIDGFGLAMMEAGWTMDVSTHKKRVAKKTDFRQYTEVRFDDPAAWDHPISDSTHRADDPKQP